MGSEMCIRDRYHPSSNGQAERMVRTFKESMKSLRSGDLDTKLNRLLFTYRMTPSTTTGKSPAELLFKRQPRSILHRLLPGNNKPELVRKDIKDDSKQVKSFGEDDPVWVKNFNDKKKWKAGNIVKKVSKVNYHVVLCGGSEVMHRHVDQLRARIPNLGIAEETIEVNPEEYKTRPERARKAPAWAKDYQIEK